ncbi:MAG TPA: biotin--[acetyl-CoA-carboxylase] ligase [Acidimicrobiales bacterium]|nr:biotin--[acetyl-CoA-carboxylase] ligase [Acidimicrobiales bacterium]
MTDPVPTSVPGPTGTRFAEVRWFEELDSTNRYLVNEARHGAGEGLVVVADHQTAGRGRLGRRWEAPPGANLLLSVLLRPSLPLASRHLASAVVALAAADACATLGGIAVDLKWPNDLQVNGRKLAGVLAEADLGTEDAERPPPIVVGIGINVGWPRPPGEDGTAQEAFRNGGELAALADSATSLLRESGRPVDRLRLLDRLLAELEPRVSELDSPQGRNGQAADLQARCSTIGRRVRVDTTEGTMTGTATAVTAEGHLVVDVDHQGPRTVVVGDVIHLRMPSEQERGRE